jgi:hypothetical protein
MTTKAELKAKLEASENLRQTVIRERDSLTADVVRVTDELTEAKARHANDLAGFRRDYRRLSELNAVQVCGKYYGEDSD